MRVHRSLKKRRTIRMIQRFAKIEILYSVIYISLAITSTMEPVERELMTAFPGLTRGCIAALLGACIWLVARGYEKHLEKNTKK